MVGANQRIAESMIGYWVQFAKTGDPNPKRTSQWPAYTEAGDQHLVLDAKFSADVGLRKQACDVYDKVFEALRTAEP